MVTFNPLLSALALSPPSGYTDYAAIGAFSLAIGTYLLKGKAWNRADPYHHLWFEKPQLVDGVNDNRKKETRDISQKLAETGHDMVIFWGSQSGTAEGFANRLARECHSSFKMNCISADLSDYDAVTIASIAQDKMVVFIISTFGEGDPSDNTAEFWQWVRSANASLKNIRYFAFGLGNSNYKYYNKVIDVVVDHLDGMGADRLMPVSRADDAKGTTEEDFIAWKESLFTYFKQTLGKQEYDVAYEPTVSVDFDDSLEPIDLYQGEPVIDRKTSATASAVKLLPIKKIRELFAEGIDRHCLHAELDLTEFPEISYKTGDHLSVWAHNPDDEVKRLVQQLGRLDSVDVPITTKSLDGSKVAIPTPTTLNILFRHYMEICHPVSRDVVSQLIQFAPTEKAASFLRDIVQDRTKYTSFLATTHINLGRLLEVCTASEPAAWSKLPLSFVVESMPSLKPRHYSISSSSVVSPRTPTITAVVAETKLESLTAAPISINGVATSYLLAHHNQDTSMYKLQRDEAEGRRVYAQIRKSKFKFPTLGSQAIIMVAAGTGIAPFRGFIQERARLKQMGKPSGQMLLFFGCRRPDEDYLYKDELAQLQQVLGGDLVIITAFSRNGGRKVYVQDRVREEGERVLDLIEAQNATLYLCGSASMAREVGNVVSGMMKQKHGWDDDETKAWGERKKKTKKFQEDVWG